MVLTGEHGHSCYEHMVGGSSNPSLLGRLARSFGSAPMPDRVIPVCEGSALDCDGPQAGTVECRPGAGARMCLQWVPGRYSGPLVSDPFPLGGALP